MQPLGALLRAIDTSSNRFLWNVQYNFQTGLKNTDSLG